MTERFSAAPRKAVIVALAAALISPAPAAVASVPPEVLARNQDADWPCIQRKVPEISAAAVWSGPALDEALQRWRDDADIAALVRELAARRLPVEEAVAAIEAFAAELPPETKAERLTLLFAGLFATLDNERGEIMQGIERYARKQMQMADRIRGEQARLSDLNAAGDDPQQAAQLTEQLIVETRVFDDRRASLTYVCEVPVLIEQRLFALGRAILGELSS